MAENKRARMAVLVSGRGSNFEALHLGLQAFTDPPAHVVGLISDQPNALALEKAERFGVSTEIIDRKCYESKADFEQALVAALQALQPDWVVLAGFMRVLSADAIAPFAGCMINIHPSLLPKYRGLHTHERVLAAHETVHGASIHFVTPELDGGPVLSQVTMAVEDDDDAESLAARLLPLEHRLIRASVALLATNEVKCVHGEITINGQVLSQPLRLGHDLDDHGHCVVQPHTR